MVQSSEQEQVVRRISNSEASAWLACQRRYFYQYGPEPLYPKTYSEPLTRGIIGHDALEQYYTALQNGATSYEALQISRSKLFSYIDHPTIIPETQTIIYDLDILLQQYVEQTDDSNWIIRSVEKMANLPLTSRYEYVLRLDLLVEERTSGKIILVDHKFVYNFWSMDEIDMSPQIPKYVATLRAQGVEIDHFLLNQLRYRKLKSGVHEFKRSPVYPSQAKLRNAIKEQIAVSEQIANFRELTPEAQFLTALPVRQMYGACKGCLVRDLCLSEYGGADITIAKELNYQKYDPFGYGYNKVESL